MFSQNVFTHQSKFHNDNNHHEPKRNTKMEYDLTKKLLEGQGKLATT